MKITVYSAKPFEIQSFRSAVGERGMSFEFVERPLNSETVQQAKGSEVVSLFSNDDSSAPILKQLAALGVKFIALRSTGFDHVDLELAKQLGIRVANAPNYSPQAIAEHTILLILGLSRKLKRSQKNMREGDFRLESLLSFELKEQTVGLVGCGEIGSAVAGILKGFGSRVIGFDRDEQAVGFSKGRIEKTPMELVFSQSDIVSLHCPLNAETRYLIDNRRIGMMKDGVILINTARGGIVKTADVLEGLESGKIGGVGLDVYEQEKAFFFRDQGEEWKADEHWQRLMERQDVLLTPHQAFFTEAAIRKMASICLENIAAFSRGDRSPNELT